MNDLALDKSMIHASQSMVERQAPDSLAKVGFWEGDLRLKYAVDDHGKTYIADRQHQGPYTVQRPFYPEGGTCHSILLHPPGGLVEGDVLSLRVDCDTASHSLITTPSAGKVYECDQDSAGQKQLFHIQDKAILEWFPQEMIVYDRSQSDLQTEIHLHGSGQFAGWEMLCLGRPIANDHFQKGRVKQKISLYRNNKPIFIERFSLDADSPLRTQSSGMANFQAMALFLMTGANQASLEIAREVVKQETDQSVEQLQLGFTLIDDVLIGRALMNQSRFAKTAFIKVWSALRLPLLNTEAIEPRIWNT